MILLTVAHFGEAILFGVTEGLHHGAIALGSPGPDNKVKYRAQRARIGEHLIAETMISGV